MITSAWDDMIIVWDLVTGSILRRIWLEASNTSSQSIKLVSNDLFACGLDGKVRVINMISGRVVRVIGKFSDIFYQTFRRGLCCICYCCDRG